METKTEIKPILLFGPVRFFPVEMETITDIEPISVFDSVRFFSIEMETKTEIKPILVFGPVRFFPVEMETITDIEPISVFDLSPVEEVPDIPVVGNEAEEPGRSIQTTNESMTEENNALNLNNGKPETGSSLHGFQTPDNVDELSIEAPKHLDEASDNVANVYPLQHGDGGESSFSVAGPVSGRITYSGPIPFSGSISIRSDSSTTSTRSFAFPVLQTEWNSSPVRMAKADRRRLQKHRGWRHGYHDQRFLSPGHMITRKLMLQKTVEEYKNQDLAFDNDQKGALSNDVQENGEEAMVNGAKRFDPTHFSTMDYSHVTRRHPIHNNQFPKPKNSP
ncbi:hypothetical protein OSB04_018187 [Centaurea solstitialis]|uniref:Uncharacterized protein n=1 Tax=Centaurea solstitialis TaxID=347529 RepID=A0AA38TMD6_9ASTR|nr:hypothetical protein OSB04_018187 [Centaurea solstitialis]